MLTKGAIGNLVNRYKAVLKKCNLINTFGSLAVASMLVLGSAGVAWATLPEIVDTPETYSNIGDLTGYPNISIKANSSGATGQLNLQGIKNAQLNTITLDASAEANRSLLQLTHGSNITFDHIIASSGKGIVQISHNEDDNIQSTATIDKITVNEGAKLTLGAWANSDENKITSENKSTSTFELNTINIGNGAKLGLWIYNTNVQNFIINGPENAPLTINLGEGGIVDFSNNGVTLNPTSVQVNVDNIHHSEAEGSVKLNKQGLGEKIPSISVAASGENNTGNVTDNLTKMANIVKLTSATEGETSEDYAVGTQLSIGEGMHAGTATATVGKDGKLENVNIKTNSVMSNILDIASSQALSMNRILMNDVRKRLGDIRAAEGTYGAWMRYDGGSFSGSNGYENDFTTFQIGFDTMPVADAPRFGVALAYTNSDADMKRGSADIDAFSLALYGTKMYDNGMFFDVIGRVATADSDIVVDGNKTGSLDNVALSLSGEFGWRFDVAEKFYIEPQAELTYTYVNSDDLTLSGGYEYDFDSVDSLIGRAGFAIGWQMPNDLGDVYARASAVHEFMGDVAVRGGSSVYERDGDDTWLEYGLGANIKLTGSTYIWADVERTEGADIDEEWRGTVGIRYSF